YMKFRQWADDYFFLPHRNETRGVGGIFFDHQDSSDKPDFEKLFGFTQRLAEAYPVIYIRLMNKNRHRPYTQTEKEWQYLRRGRYVEFNLLYDRGTKFGLESGGRTESIFLSMPPMAAWTYDFTAEKGSREAHTLSLLKKNIDWEKDEL
ncbi:MAG: coproporphyrinogen III oxidase, partial [Mangrovibacterium sp.]